MKSRDLKRGMFWIDSHFEGLKPLIFSVRPWIDRLGGGGGGCRDLGEEDPLLLLLPLSLFAAADRFPREELAGAPRESLESSGVGCELCCGVGREWE